MYAHCTACWELIMRSSVSVAGIDYSVYPPFAASLSILLLGTKLNGKRSSISSTDKLVLSETSSRIAMINFAYRARNFSTFSSVTEGFSIHAQLWKFDTALSTGSEAIWNKSLYASQ